MPRGRQLGVYESDGGTDYKTQVDSDRFGETGFSWAAPTGALPQMPRGFVPRHVVGIDTAGFRGTAVVPHLTSTLWTGVATVFNIEGSDGTTYVCTVTQKFGEKPSLP